MLIIADRYASLPLAADLAQSLHDRLPGRAATSTPPRPRIHQNPAIRSPNTTTTPMIMRDLLPEPVCREPSRSIVSLDKSDEEPSDMYVSLPGFQVLETYASLRSGRGREYRRASRQGQQISAYT